MYNKRKFNKVNDKKVLHKVKKQWVTISLSLLMMIGGGAIANHVNVSADTVQATPVTRLGHQAGHKNITSRANSLHKTLLSKAAKRVNKTPRKPINTTNRGNVATVNNQPVGKINNINALKVNQSKFYKGQIYNRVNIPFNKMRVNHKIALHSSINLKHDHVYGYLYNGNIVKIARAFKEFGRYNNYLRYEIHLNKKRSAFISGNGDSLSYRLPSKNYKYYQKRINKLVHRSNPRVAKRIRRALTKLNRKRKFNYRKYAQLYEVAFNAKRNAKVVVDYNNSNSINSATSYTSTSNNDVSETLNSVASSSVSEPAKSVKARPSSISTSVKPIMPASSVASAPSSVSIEPSSSSYVASSNSMPSADSVSSVVSSSSDVMPQSSFSDNIPAPVVAPSSSDNESDTVPQPVPDATHKYLAPNYNNQDVMFSSDGISDVENHNINYRSNDNLSDVYNIINPSDNSALVHLIGNKNLLGYNLTEISDSDGSNWVFSDELTNDKNAKYNGNDYNNFNNTLENGYGTDATHKYLVPDNVNKNVTLGSLSSDGNYSDYNNSDVQAPVFVNILGTKTVLGYNFDKINISNNDSDANNQWVLSDELSATPKAHNNDVQQWQNFLNTVQHHYFTPNEINQINNIKQRYDYLKQNEDSSNNIYAVQPNLPNHVVGQLTNNFKKDMTDWVNFYRGLYNMTPVNDAINYDTQAQYGADGCNALGEIEHGLNGMSAKPSNITASDWQKGIDATNSSNLSGGGASDPDDIEGYFDDGDNLTGNNTGHRAWILDQGLHNIGIGVDNGYGDLYVITPSDSSINSSDENNPAFKDIAFPNVGLFPYSDAIAGPWSLYVPNDNELSNVKVSVHDDTNNVDVPVTDIETDEGFGYYNIITYKPNNVRANHQYTITISGQNVPKGSYTYTTKLFKINE